MISVIIGFRKSNKNLLKLRTDAERSSRKKRHILVNPETNVVIFHEAYFYFIFNQLWQETTIHSRSMKTCSTNGVFRAAGDCGAYSRSSRVPKCNHMYVLPHSIRHSQHNEQSNLE